MNILALDTSTEVAGISLLSNGRLRFSHSFLHRMDLSQRLLPTTRWLLEDAGLSLDAVHGLVVGLGPGSFTGVRIGVTTAKVLAQASNLPVVGIGTLEAMAGAFAACEDALVCPCIDARRQEVYAGLYRVRPERLEELLPPRALRADALAQDLREYGEAVILCGTGSVSYRDTLEEALGGRFRYAHGHDFPDPVVLAHLGRRRLDAGERDDPLGLRPVYARLSEAERALARACAPAEAQG